MNIMKKITLAIVAIAIFSAAFAQKGDDKRLHFSVGPEVGFATGDFNITHSVGFGATAQAEYNVGTGTDITFTAGYLSYAGRSAGSGIKFKAAGILPLKAGVKYTLVKSLYGAAQLGVGIFNNNGGSAFAYTPMVGYEFSTNSGNAVDASLKYDGYSKSNLNWGAVGIRLAYIF
jgi:hypothetical protein